MPSTIIKCSMATNKWLLKMSHSADSCRQALRPQQSTHAVGVTDRYLENHQPTSWVCTNRFFHDLFNKYGHSIWWKYWSPTKLYRSQVRSKLDYGCIVYGSASKTALAKLDPVHNQGLRLSLGAFRSSPVESLYVEAHEPPLEIRRENLN